MPSPSYEAVPLSTVFFKLVVPFLGAICLTLFKVAADNRFLTLKDSNDIALDLVVVSLVAMATFHPGKGEDVYTAIATINLLSIGILLVLRGVGRRHRAKFKKAGNPVPPTYFRSALELLLGFLAAYSTVGLFRG